MQSKEYPKCSDCGEVLTPLVNYNYEIDGWFCKKCNEWKSINIDVDDTSDLVSG